MTDMNDIQNEEQQQPIIPPVILFAVAGLGLLTALTILLTQPTFGAVGYGALVISVLALVLVVVLAPQSVANALTGRSLRFGGTSVIFTVIFLAVLVTVYWFIQQQDWTYDLSETDQFSLNEESRQVIQQMGTDPAVPPIELLAFYDATQVTQQEQTEILFEAYEEASGGKVSYRFVNPDRSPTLAQSYNAFPGDFVVRETGTEDSESAEVVPASQGFNQNQLTNAILSVAASGDFRAYFLELPDSISPTDVQGTGISDITSSLTDRLRWQVEAVSIIELTSPETAIELGSSAVDGDVLVLAGGAQVLDDTTVNFITDYVEQGGNLVIMASLDGTEPATASTESLNAYLESSFGIRFNTDVVVLDPTQSFNQPVLPAITELSRQNFITTNNLPQGTALVMPFTRTIATADAPETVITYDLGRSSNASYTKTTEEVLNDDLAQTPEDPEGPFTVMAAAEASNTGARVVLIGSASMATNQFALLPNVSNQQVTFNALLWAAGYDDFFETLPQVDPFDVRPQDTPVAAESGTLRLVNFISLFALPFGVLLIGAAVWATRRDS